MSEIYDKAMDRLRDEMAGGASAALRGVGEMVTAMLRQRPEWAAQIGAADKSLKGLYAEMYKAAKAKKEGDAYCMTQDEAAGIAAAYYGLSGERPDFSAATVAAPPTPSAPAAGAQTPAPEPEADPMDELDALLAGL